MRGTGGKCGGKCDDLNICRKMRGNVTIIPLPPVEAFLQTQPEKKQRSGGWSAQEGFRTIFFTRTNYKDGKAEERTVEISRPFQSFLANCDVMSKFCMDAPKSRNNAQK